MFPRIRARMTIVAMHAIEIMQLLCDFENHAADTIYRGFERKGGGIRIINFRITTTRFHSKSNRCI